MKRVSRVSYSPTEAPPSAALPPSPATPSSTATVASTAIGPSTATVPTHSADEPPDKAAGKFPGKPADKIVTVAEMQALERMANEHGHSFAAMMDQAGEAVAREIVTRTAPAHPRILVLVGPGNNGGDGLVCAHTLHGMGLPVRVYLWQRRTQPDADFEVHYAKTITAGIEAAHVDADSGLDLLSAWLAESDVLVDALLGTGSNRAITGTLAALLDQVRSRMQVHPLLVCAVDCPSGLNCDSGQVDPHTLAADFTVTFAHAKQGLYKFPGAAIAGEVVVAGIGIDPSFADGVRTFVLTRDAVRSSLPPRNRLSHKGSFGKVMVAAGSTHYPGAAALATGAAGRVGAGLVTGAVADVIWPLVASQRLEPTWLPLPHEDGALASAASPLLREGLRGYDALVVGCGLSQRPATVRFMEDLLREPGLPPTLFDADGLNCLAQIAEWPRLLPPSSILTPHPAELARLTGNEVGEVVSSRWEIARECAARWNVVVLAKGPYTVIAAPDGRLAVLPVATPSLATAGTGDVLSGTIGGLMAQGLDAFAAGCVGAWAHGAAGLLCEREIGLAGVIASDLLPRLPAVLKLLREDAPQNFASGHVL